MEQTFRCIHDLQACAHAAEQVGDGEVVGSYIRGVCGLWIDGGSSKAFDLVDQIKGEKRTVRPFGTTLDGPEFAGMIDPDQIAVPARGLFMDSDQLLPGFLFKYLLQEWELDLNNFKPGKYPLVQVPEELFAGAMTGHQLRNALIDHLDG